MYRYKFKNKDMSNKQQTNFTIHYTVSNKQTIYLYYYFNVGLLYLNMPPFELGGDFI